MQSFRAHGDACAEAEMSALKIAATKFEDDPDKSLNEFDDMVEQLGLPVPSVHVPF